MPTTVDGERCFRIDVSLDDGKRNGTVFEVMGRRRDNAHRYAVDQHGIAPLCEFGVRTVEVQSHESAGWVTNVVNLGNRLLSGKTALRQVHRGS